MNFLKINPFQLSNALGVYKNQKINGQKVQRVQHAKDTRQKDQIQLSEKAQDFKTILKTVRESQDIRSDKVESIKERMQSGEYKVSSSDIAEKMLKDILLFKRCEG